MSGHDGKQEGKGKRRKSDKVEEGRITKKRCPHLKISDEGRQELETQFFRAMLNGSPPWDNITFMCAPWYTRAKCFVNCNNKACHVGAWAIP